MDDLSQCLTDIDLKGVSWDTVACVIKHMKETVTLHDGRILNEKELTLLCCPTSGWAKRHLAFILDKGETCVISGIEYDSITLYVHWLEEDWRLGWRAHDYYKILKLMEKHYPDTQYIHPVKINKNRSYLYKDLAVCGLRDSFANGSAKGISRRFFMVRLAMCMEKDETIAVTLRSTYTRLTLLLEAFNCNPTVRDMELYDLNKKLLDECIPSDMCLERNADNKYTLEKK